MSVEVATKEQETSELAKPEISGEQTNDQQSGSRFMACVTSLPMVSSAINYASSSYNTIKETYPAANYTLTMAEESLAYVAEQAKPIAQQFDKQVKVVDDLAAKGVNVLAEKAPIITKQPHEILEDTKSLCATAVQTAVQTGLEKYEEIKKYSTEKVVEAADYSIQKAVELATNPAVFQKIQGIADSVNGALTKTEQYIDHYLPPEENEVSKDNDKVLRKNSISDRVNNISNKVSQRMHRQAVIQLQNVQKRNEEFIQKLHYTVDLIQNVKGNINMTRQKVYDAAKIQATWLWEELNKEEKTEEDASNKTLEKHLVSIARRITHQLVETYNNTGGIIQSLPLPVQDTVALASRYSAELHNQLLKVTDVTSSVIDLLRSKLRTIEETMAKAMETARNSPEPPNGEVEEIEMQQLKES